MPHVYSRVKTCSLLPVDRVDDVSNMGTWGVASLAQGGCISFSLL